MRDNRSLYQAEPAATGQREMTRLFLDGSLVAARGRACAAHGRLALSGSSPKSVIEVEVSFMQRLAREVGAVNPRFI